MAANLQQELKLNIQKLYISQLNNKKLLEENTSLREKNKIKKKPHTDKNTLQDTLRITIGAKLHAMPNKPIKE